MNANVQAGAGTITVTGTDAVNNDNVKVVIQDSAGNVVINDSATVPANTFESKTYNVSGGATYKVTVSFNNGTTSTIFTNVVVPSPQ